MRLAPVTRRNGTDNETLFCLCLLRVDGIADTVNKTRAAEGRHGSCLGLDISVTGRAELVEHNFELREFRATPLTHYSDQFSDHMIMTETIFETERLRCRQFNFYDLEDFFELGSDPDVIRFAEPRPLRDIAEARQRMIDAPMRDYEVYGYGRLAVELKSSGEVIGFCGIKRLEELELDELGYRFKKHHWGMGYATEAGSATLLYAWRELGLDRVIALILDGNDASVNVATKLGMQQRDYVNFDGERPMLFDIHRPD